MSKAWIVGYYSGAHAPPEAFSVWLDKSTAQAEADRLNAISRRLGERGEWDVDEEPLNTPTNKWLADEAKPLKSLQEADHAGLM